MEQLTKKVGRICNDWNSGAATCGERYLPPHRISMGVSCFIDDEEDVYAALLDTGSAVSLVGDVLAEELLSKHDPVDPPLRSTMTHRLSGASPSGPLIRIKVTLIANQGGSNLEVDSIVMACPEWQGPPIVLGRNGFLEAVRVGLERTRVGKEYLFYFGQSI